jgi:hypothetical protein
LANILPISGGITLYETTLDNQASIYQVGKTIRFNGSRNEDRRKPKVSPKMVNGIGRHIGEPQ